MGIIKIKPLIFNIVTPLLLGFIVGMIAPNTKEIYQSLNLPSFAPPAFLFGIVWSILYILLGIAAYRVQISSYDSSEKRKILILYWIEIFLTLIWQPIYFTLSYERLSFWLIVLMIIIGIIIFKRFYKIDKVAGILVIPFLLWLVFAGILLLSINKLN